MKVARQLIESITTAQVESFAQSASAAAPVQSVAGKTGAVSLLSADVAGPVISTQEGTSFTLVANNANNAVLFSAAAAVAVMIPANSSVPFPLQTQIVLIQSGAGQLTVQGAAGVTLQSSGGKTKSGAQYAILTLFKVATDTWILGGDITT